MTTLQCEFSGCSWVSDKAELELCIRLLEIHVKAKHTEPKSSVKPTNHSVRPEKAKRPELSAEVSDEDWAYFLSRWAEYKKATGLEGEETVLQLMECCSEQLRREHHRTFPKGGTEAPTETTRLEELRQLAVRKKNRAVNRVKLGTMKQDKGEPVRKFTGRIRSLAAVSGYSVTCGKCQDPVPYTDAVIMDQVIAGLADTEIQKDVLSHPDAATMDLDKLLQFVEGKESGQASQGLLSGSVVGAVKQLKCKFCGSYHDKGRQFCKAAGKKCDKCGKMNHLAAVCRSRVGQDTSTDYRKDKTGTQARQDSSSEHVDAAWDGNWACSVSHTDTTKPSTWGDFNSYIQETEFVPKDANKYPKSYRRIFSRPSPGRNVIPGTVLAIMVGSVIMSTRGGGDASPTQAALITQHGQVERLSHHVFSKGRGWLRQAAKSKPMVLVRARVDKPAYTALQVRAPLSMTRISEGYQLADSGASICLGGKQFMRSLGLQETDLTPCDMSVCGANNENIRVLGAVLVELEVRGSPATSKQIIYICDGVAGALLSLEACIDLGLIHNKFPNQPATEVCTVCSTMQQQPAKKKDCNCDCPVRSVAPDPPVDIPFKPIAENIPKLEAWIRETYAASAFNCCECQPLPRMHGPPLKIHMQEGVKPIASHTPIPVPLHWHKKVKAGLDRDEAIGVIERVPAGTPTTWCHRMVVVPKKDNTPRRTVNFQPLNQYSSRQTHHTQSPFHQATSIPAGVKKTVLDAWNGYHSVYLDPTCRDLTTFITPWGRYRYKTAPQGYLAAGDAYTERFDRIIADIQDKTKCVDDTVLWSKTVEASFFDTCQFLSRCSKNGVVFNKDKFQFCKDEVEFAGFLIGKDYVKPAPKILESIRNFPVPKTISEIRGWFGLVNQVSPFFASRPVMEPFRELLKPAEKGKQVYWDDNLTALFEESKTVIIEAIQEGIKTFEMGRWTCLMPDFCKTGVGYLLMQKKCNCEKITPYCCTGGWQVVLAGSRFTKDAETRYAPVEGEALACWYGLESTRHYTLGNPKLLIASDHKPLLKILGDRKLEDIDNPRLAKLKEKMLRWKFDIIHVPGKVHVGPDTLSRQEVTVSLVNIFAQADDNDRFQSIRDMETVLEAAAAASCDMTLHPISWQDLREAVARDKVMSMLADQVRDGFPPEKKLLRLELREYYQHRENLSQVDGVPLFKGRVVVPAALRAAVL